MIDASLLFTFTRVNGGMQSFQNTHEEQVNLPLHLFTYTLYQFSCLQLCAGGLNNNCNNSHSTFFAQINFFKYLGGDYGH